MMETLASILTRPDRLAIAVSGGVDSLTLAVTAQRLRAGKGGVAAYHAVSPAVPREATERVQHHADKEGIMLHIIDAGEFSDPDYLRNPLHRCFHCKTNLYGAIARQLDGRGAVIMSGTNRDDLGDFRPGLAAAKDHGVVHPYVEAGMDKAAVRSLARQLGLPDIAELPSSPCLASRVETGLRIDPQILRMIEAVERRMRDRLGPVTLRCRVRAGGLALEVDSTLLARMSDEQRRALETEARRLAETHGAHAASLRLEAYQQGSAFNHAG
ncbi:adenine nucleotide alpha hydrolase [Telmatospirillum sp. J64-1]|uniref:adenine nucleotide alpha hydrolase n=1 Tax=Telmatospirillum sp. J64-1 TaxID=2502183 RepID=UPI00115DE1F1|nr:adenine nucleotide alpha hydrolase [Telmatospirillum sp. J64-1]